jgi:hypothetical protein
MREIPGVGTGGRLQQPRVTPPDENDMHDITLPIRIISSRDSHPGGSLHPHVSWFKKYEEDGVRHTPEFTEIGDQQE